MQLLPIRPRLVLRATASALLVLALAACGASAPSGGDGDGDGGDNGSTTDFRWVVIVPNFLGEINGTTATISADAFTGTDSVPAGWSLVMSRPGGFVDLGTYASYEDLTSGVGGDLTVTITAPGGASCTVGPAQTTVTEDGPEVGDTFTQATYFGTSQADGRPIVTFAYVSAACDGLPGASGSGTVDVWQFGFGDL